MGSWHETCGITQLPIQEGEDVALFILEEYKGYVSEKNGFTASHHLYNPIGPPVFGRYNEYGTIDNISDDGNLIYKHMIKKLKTEYELIEIGANKTIVLSNETRDINSINEIVKLLERGLIKGIKFMLVHMELYDELVYKIGEQKIVELSEFIYTSENINRKNTKFRDKIMGDIQDYENIVKSNKNLPMFILEDQLIENYYFKYTNDYLNYYRNEQLFKESFKKRMCKFIIFDYIMNSARKLWVPQSGAGSQTLAFDISGIIADCTLSHIREYENKCNE